MARKWKDPESTSSTIYTVSRKCSLRTGALVADLITAGQYFKTHVNVFEDDHALVQMSRPGDRVVLWIRAKYPVSSLSQLTALVAGSGDVIVQC